jgi:hypothetical protein
MSEKRGIAVPMRVTAEIELPPGCSFTVTKRENGRVHFQVSMAEVESMRPGLRGVSLKGLMYHTYSPIYVDCSCEEEVFEN